MIQDSANKGLVQEIVFQVFHRCLYNEQLQNTRPTDLHTLNNNSVHCNISRSSKTPTPGPGILQSLLTDHTT